MKFNKLILILVFLILFCNFVKGDLVFEEVICSKDGSLKLKVYSEDKKIPTDDIKVIVGLKDTFFDLTLSRFEVNGTWSKDYISDEKTFFNSNVAQINNLGDYDIILEYIEGDIKKDLVYEKECPGLIFSCELVKVDIENCTIVDDRYFNLLVELSGINQSTSRKLDIFEDISYGVVAENSYMDIRSLYSNKGSLPEDIKIDKINNNLYLFSKEFINNSILSVNIYLRSLRSECKNSKLYDYKECIKIYTNKIEEKDIEKETEVEEKEQEDISKITGEIIKIREPSSFNKNYSVYIIIGIIVLSILIVIIKKQKVNKWV